MQENMKEYLTEKEAREKRLEVYTEKIQEKVLSRSSETIRQLVEERHRQKMTQQEIADITANFPCFSYSNQNTPSITCCE